MHAAVIRARKLISNVDLWQQIEAILESRGGGAVKVTKVKAHATMKEVENGDVSHRDKLGNDAADSLAVAGASKHGFDREAKKKILHRLESARCLQSMMVAILQARAESREKLNLNGSSDTDDDNDDTDDDSSCVDLLHEPPD